jgi:quinol-cytochrome oxidoreductase complex cytochrome b subunit
MSPAPPRESRSGPSWPRRVWKSIFRGPVVPTTDRDRRWVVFHHLVLHFRPTQLPAKTIRYTHTFGLGGMSLVLFATLLCSGVLLLFAYEPTPGTAYDSILALQNDTLFGRLIRNVHHWSANFLIALMLLHLLRVFFTGAFHGARQFNWIIGLALLGGAMLSNLTGYLLPWDQLAYWATTIITGMLAYVPWAGEWLQGVVRGGEQISSATLITFYAVHTTILPVAIVGLMTFHFWRVRKAGGVVIPRAPAEEIEERPEKVLFLPHLLQREFAVALALIAVIVLVSVAFNAPLADRANPGMSPNPAKAPWYFAGFQELLLHFEPLFAVVILPCLAVLGLLFIPYFRYHRNPEGVLMASHPGRRGALWAAVMAAVATPIWIVADEFKFNVGDWFADSPGPITHGLLPTVLILAGVAIYWSVLKRRYDLDRSERVQALFVLLAVAFAILTLTGVWFRGPGMALVWPWSA